MRTKIKCVLADSVSWRKLTWTKKWKITWPNELACYSCRSTRMSSLHWETRHKRVFFFELWSPIGYVQRRQTSPVGFGPICSYPFSIRDENCKHRPAKCVADMTIKSVLSNSGLFVQVAETALKMLQRAINDLRLQDMEGASTTVADDDPSIAHSRPCTTTLSKIPSASKLHEEHSGSNCRRCNSSHPKRQWKLVSKGQYSVSNIEWDSSSEHGAAAVDI